MSDLDPLKFRTELGEAVVRYAAVSLPRGAPKTARLAEAFFDLLAHEKDGFVRSGSRRRISITFTPSQ
jgi:hypothetical protein